MSSLLHRHKKLVRRAIVQSQVLNQCRDARSQSFDPSIEMVPTWNRLSRKDEVSIYLEGEKIATGRVDMTDLDGRVFWIIQNEGKGRIMVHHCDGIVVFRDTRKSKNAAERPNSGV